MVEYVAVCTECKNRQSDKYVENSSFYKSGMSPPCKWCGGVTRIVDVTKEKKALSDQDRKRGLK